MQELLEKIRGELRGAWRFRRYALLTAWVVCVLGWIVVLALPDTYEARARMNVDTRTALRPLLQGIAVDPDLESQLNLVRQTLLGTANLERVARQVGLDVTAKTPAERAKLLADLSERIEIALEPPTIRDPRIPNTLYRITYRDGNREQALKVVDVLLNSFVEGTMGSERSGTANAQKFLREQLVEYDRRLAEAEARLAEFKKKNVGLVPGEQGDYFTRLQNELQEINRIEAALTVAASRRAELERQLRGETPFVPPTEPVAGAPRAGSQDGPRDTATRILETQARLDDLLLRFTDKHPDVVATRETLEQLKKQQQQELEALKRGDLGAATLVGAAANPVYQTIQLQLNETDVQIASLRGELAEHRKNEADLRKLIDTVPEVEAEFARLTRDYDVTKTQYNELLQRLEQARVSGGAEQSGVAQFNIVDPPSASFSPIFPNRPLLLTAVFVLGLGFGGGVAYLLHLLKPVFVTSRTLADVTGVPVLGTVARTWIELQKREIRRGLLRYSAAGGLLFVLYVAAVATQGPVSRLMSAALS
ncbi:MAG TPA: XrtA system polysaccharide chain length determinant [Steroidobacteraceae bacterium]